MGVGVGVVMVGVVGAAGAAGGLALASSNQRHQISRFARANHLTMADEPQNPRKALIPVKITDGTRYLNMSSPSRSWAAKTYIFCL